ncbi:hypothetical protein NM22_01005 [Vibrio tubiashii]|nr:hypothetical protein NM22_01005 [Vibrio tubiashii]
MLRRVFSYIWLVMLAMVLPTQAFAYLLQAENEASARLALRSNSTLTPSSADFQAILESAQQTPKTKPATQADFSHNWLAILNSSRGSITTRFLDDGESFSGNDVTHFEPCVVALYQRYELPQYEAGFRLTTRYTSPYRLSGWKDSNTLYVALNGQYSVTS